MPPSGAVGNVSAPAGTEEQVTVRDGSFEPSEITVAEGTTVTWVNEDEQGHTVTNGEGGAPAAEPLFDEPLNAEQTVSYTFEEPGTYPVTCRVHHDMQMTVTVEESGS
jgi:plastocyanin